MSDNKSQLMQLIKQGSPSQLITSQVVGDRFQQLFSVIHGIKNQAKAAAFYQAEQFHFLKLVNDNPKIAACTKLSLYGVFMDVAVNGLSVDPSMKHLYVVPYNVNVGTKQEPKWEARASLQISGQGELLLRTLQGQIKYADNPVLVYEGDEFKFGSRDGKVILDHVASIPRKSNNIIASYLKITRHDDTIDYKVLTAEDIASFRKFSKDPNSKAWTDGMPGMVQAKTIKHAFKNYPKVRVGEFSKMESETIDTEIEPENVTIDYGLTPEAIAPAVNEAAQPAAATAPADDNSFAETTVVKEGASIVHQDENF